jgi:hypothetical protein
MVYGMVSYIFDKLGYAMSSKSEIIFDRFSFQYIAIIMIIISMTLANLKNINIILKVARYGVISIITLIVFV